jgi:hypothetical protein
MASRDITLFESASRVAAAYNSDDQSTSFAKGVIIFLNITALTGTLDLKIQAKDTVSGTYIDQPGCSLAQQAGTGIDILTVYPGIAETANVSVSDRLPKVWRVVCTVGTGPITFSVFAQAVD